MIGADEASNLPYLLELLSVEESGLDQITIAATTAFYAAETRNSAFCADQSNHC